MKAEYKEKWLIALRSNEFQQGSGRLVGEFLDGDRPPEGRKCYCCLGVLATFIPGVEERPHWEMVDTLLYEEEDIDHLQVDGQLDGEFSNRLLQIVGLSDKEQQKLIGFNDTDGWSFDEIADWLEEHA